MIGTVTAMRARHPVAAQLVGAGALGLVALLVEGGRDDPSALGPVRAALIVVAAVLMLDDAVDAAAIEFGRRGRRVDRLRWAFLCGYQWAVLMSAIFGGLGAGEGLAIWGASGVVVAATMAWLVKPPSADRTDALARGFHGRGRRTAWHRWLDVAAPVLAIAIAVWGVGRGEPEDLVADVYLPLILFASIATALEPRPPRRALRMAGALALVAAVLL